MIIIYFRKILFNLFQIINVSGTIFIADMLLFKSFPDTLLGSAEMERYYNEEREEYFIERHRKIFTSVLRFYTHDKEIYCPPCCSKFLFEVSQYLTLAGLKHCARSSKIMTRQTRSVYPWVCKCYHITYCIRRKNNCKKIFK